MSVILQSTEFSIATLFASDQAVGVCRAAGERLTILILLVREASWGVAVVQTVTDEHYLIAAAASVHQGNLFGDIRKWSRYRGYHFSLKRSDERITTERDNIFMLADGSVVEVRHVFALASNFTRWGLQDQEALPDEYARF